MSTVIFEVEYRGRRYAGVGLPTDAPVTLFPVAEDQLRNAVLAGGGTQALLDSLTSGADTITIAADDPEIHFLPPLLPASNNSLVTGFMGTHRSKFPASARKSCRRALTSSSFWIHSRIATSSKS